MVSRIDILPVARRRGHRNNTDDENPHLFEISLFLLLKKEDRFSARAGVQAAG